MAKAKDKLEAVIAVPLGDMPSIQGYEQEQCAAGMVTIEGYPPRVHIQAQLGPEAAMAFMRIRNGLREQNAKLGNGRPVYSNADTLRWLMEQVAGEAA
jgi:hypothetical protein